MELCELFTYFGNQTLAEVTFANIFSHIVGSLFILLIFSLAVQKLFILMKSHLSYSFIYVPCSRGHIGENILHGVSEDFPIFSSRTFMVS